MSTSAPSHPTGASTSSPTYFEQQRSLLVGEIAQSLEHVLQNINKLNRSLEGVIAVGNEFSSVEALWSQFEKVMGTERDEAGGAGAEGKGERDGREEDG